MSSGSIAFVDPVALKSMAKKVQVLREELDTVSKKLLINIEALYQEGHRDIKYGELRNRVNESQAELRDLMLFMDSYRTYLEKQEKVISAFLNSKKM
jgi:maltooligosyltrehalose synthase